MEMEDNKNDFVMDSKGHCFICLDEISAVNHGKELIPPKYSLHYLSRYVKMDMSKVFHDAERIPPHLLAKVERSRLKVGLCDECLCLIEQFSENYRKLEKMEMELGSCLKRIHAKFLDQNVRDKADEFKTLASVMPHLKLSSGGELEILEVLREEAYQKSRNKLRAVVPRVKCSHLTKNEINREQLRSRAINELSKDAQKISAMDSSSVSHSHFQGTGMKMELDTTFLSEDDNVNMNCSSNDSNFDNQAMSDDDAEDTTSNVEGITHESNNNTPTTTEISLSSVKKIPSRSRTQVETPISNINPETGKFKCSTCVKEFSTKLGFKYHFESVHLKVRFNCVNCGKQFAHRSNFDRHQKGAHGGVKYECKKSFKRSDEVRNHQRTTDCGKKLGLKPGPKHTCHLCGKTSSRKADLKKHLNAVHFKT